MPARRPNLPNGASVHHLVGFGQDPRADKVVWILFGSDSDLEAWFNSITQTLPKQNPPPQQQPNAPGQNYPPAQPPTSNQPNNSYVPPSQYPSGPNVYTPQQRGPGVPPPVYSNGPPPPNQQYYGNQPQQPQSTHTTVIVDRDRGYNGGGYSSGSSGLGFGSGMLAGIS